MIRRALAAHLPKARRELNPLEFGPAHPPFLPKRAKISARGRIKIGEVRGAEEAGDAEEQGIDIVLRGAHQLERNALSEQRKGQLVAFVAKDRSDSLVERF